MKSGLRCRFFILLAGCLCSQSIQIFAEERSEYPPQMNHCCHHFSAEVDYLLAWRKHRDSPPLLTTSPAGINPITTNPETEVLFGGGEIGDSPQSGIRGALIFSICDRMALSAKGFWVNDEKVHAFISSDSQGVPSIGIPYFQLFSDVETAFEIAFQGSFVGEAKVDATNKVWGANAAIEWQMMKFCNGDLTFLAGYQRYNVDDKIHLEAHTDFLFLPNVSDINNDFITENTFNGGLLGLRADFAYRCWGLSLLAKVGLGEMSSLIRIEGAGVITPPTGEAVGFVQDTNRGTYHESHFSAVTEIAVRPSYRINDCLYLTAGYTLIYWPNVYLAGKQIDRRLNTVAPSDFPKFLNQRSDFWLQGMTVGLKAYF